MIYSMRIAIVNDTHYGVRGNAEVFMHEAEVFFEHLIADCKARGIDRVLHLGDFFDNRKNINILVLQRAKEKILDRLAESGIHMDIIYGNHDVYYKNTNRYSSLDGVIDPYYTQNGSVNIIRHPQCLPPPYDDIAAVPWITEDNYEECMTFIESAPAPILVGHFEIEGFRYLPQSSTLSKGFSRDIFKNKYDLILSGHYHTKSQRDNIIYLGTQMQFTWADADDPKCYHILEGESREDYSLTSVPYEQNLFIRCEYDDSKKIPLTNLDRIKNAQRPVFVRVRVQKKKDTKTFERVIENLSKLNVHSVEVIEDFNQYLNPDSSDADADDEAEEKEEEKIQELLEDTTKLIEQYVDEEIDEASINKDKLKDYINDLYQTTVFAESEK